MIQFSQPILQTKRWKKSMANSIQDPAELLSVLELSPKLLPAARQLAHQFPLRVPRSFVDRMEPGNPRDPLLLQVLPLNAENYSPEEYSQDPLSEIAAIPSPGMIHKYHGRVLLTMTGACPIHCRYCFRRHFPYNQFSLTPQNWQQTFDYLASREDIAEIILSGGDPLSVSDDKIAEVLAALCAISHIQTIRIHTRMPVVIPERVTDELISILSNPRFNFVVVLHINHANEINHEVRRGCQMLSRTGAILFNQSVLLRRINDSNKALIELCEAVFSMGVIPYYLHMLDPVYGAAHFSVSDIKAQHLVKSLRSQLPGYMIPTLVREIPGENSKTPL